MLHLNPSGPAVLDLDRLITDVILYSTCGPTTYDDAHLGHARNYVSTDVIRRIMRDYFGLPVKFVMNITDVRFGISLGRRCDADEDSASNRSMTRLFFAPGNNTSSTT